jgi:hypothetical protein
LKMDNDMGPLKEEMLVHRFNSHCQLPFCGLVTRS